MKWNHFPLFVLSVLSLNTFAQKPKVQWGDEFKMRKGSTDLEVVYADNSGVYLQEGHLALKSYFVIGATVRSSATLVKLDKHLGEIYRSDFNKELKGKEFEQFFVLQGKMYMFASDYNKKEKTLTVFGAEVDKGSGTLLGEWKEITSFQKEEKNDDINYKIAYNADSTSMIVVSSVLGKAKNEYKVQEYDKTLKTAGKPVILSNEFDPKTFQLEDVLYTFNKKTILVGRVYEFQEGKKKKEKFLDFANYNIRLYDETGKQQTEINTSINGKWVTSAKLVQEKNKDLVLVAFYNNNKKGKTIDGMLVQRIDPTSGKVLSTREKQINNSMLGGEMDLPAADPEDDGKETRAERKERERLDKIKDEGEGFSKYMQFRNVFYTADKGLVILAEKYHSYMYSSSSYTPGSNGMPGSWTTTTYQVYECGDLLLCKVDETGNIGWLQVVPKTQREVISVGRSSGFGGGISFWDGTNRPFYAGFGAIQYKNAIHILFNDNPKNAVVTQPGQTVKSANRFGKTDCFILTFDEASGKVSRRMFFSNNDIPTSMPRLGSVMNENMSSLEKKIVYWASPRSRWARSR